MATDINKLSRLAGGSTSYADFLNRAAGSGGLEGNEANALLKGGFETGTSVKNSLANVLTNGIGGVTGDYGHAQLLGYNQYGQVAGGYGAQGLNSLNDIYYKTWSDASRAQSGVGATGGGGSGATQAGLTASQRSAIESQWNQNNRYYNDLLGSIDPRRQAAQQAVDRSVGTSSASLQTERDAAYENLDRQDTKLEKGYTQGRQSLGEMVRNTLQGESNNIGMMGGGNSSAIGMLGVGVSDMQNAEQGRMLDDLNEQKTDIELNRGQVDKKLKDELRKLNDFKQSKYQEIQDTFNSERNEILNKLNMNDNQRAQALAQANALSTQMIQNVDNTINGRLEQIATTYRNINAPTVSLADIPAYEARNIAPGAINNNGNTPPQALTPGQAVDSIQARRSEEDDYLFRPLRSTDEVYY